MNIRKFLYRHVVYPSVLYLRGEYETYEIKDKLESIQWQDSETIREIQKSKLASILRYGVREVQRYRGYNLDPRASDGELYDALKTLPVLTKRDVQEEKIHLTADQLPRRTSEKTTGGSTWEPVTIIKDATAIAHERAATWLAYGWYNVRMGDRGARFWGYQTQRGFTQFKQRMIGLITNRVRFSAFRFTQDDLEMYWQRCLEIEPDYFYGYVSMLTEFARYIRARGYDGTQLNLKAIISTAESLTLPQRELLYDTFNAPIQNEYGCGEVGPIAYECPEGSLHIMCDNVFVEVLDEHGREVDEGETGRVVVTDLNNRAMPLIRYSVGDVAVRGTNCDCGRGLAVLSRICGREDDFVEDRGGRRYHGEYFIHAFEELADLSKKVGRLRVVQEVPGELVIEVERGGQLPKEDRQRVIEYLEKDMTGVKISVTDVDSIPRLESGKTRVVENRVSGSTEAK